MTLLDHFIEQTEGKRDWAGEMAGSMLWRRCSRGHQWQAPPETGEVPDRGCPYCADDGPDPVLPDMMRLWHPSRNGALRPEEIPPGSRKVLWWRCRQGHEWQAPAYSIKAGTGCPYCSGRRPIPGETDLRTTHPQLLNRWSDENRLTPAEVTAGSHKKVWWVCERGHRWEAAVVTVALKGCGCPYCMGKKAVPGETDLATVKPELLAEWDFEKNTLDPAAVLPSSHDKVWWKCQKGHQWQAMIFSRTRDKAAGCPYCTGRKVLPGFNDLQTLQPGLARQWHPILNGALTPEQVTLGSNKKVWWRCSDGHVWQAFVYARTKPNGTGCPVCTGKVRERPPGRSSAD